MQVSSHRNYSIINPSVEASSVLCAPGCGMEVVAAGRMAAAVVRVWGHHAAVTCLPTDGRHNFTLRIGH